MPVSEKGNSQPKIYGIASKVNQVIHTLVCNYMPNIKILTNEVFSEILFTSLFPYKMPVFEKGG